MSLCMIVKNEEAHLERCLESIAPYVSEIVIVDTGSTDKTPKIALRYADKFVRYTECNYPDGNIRDFSLARQRSFDLATQPWVMWIDSDDVVVGAQHLRKMLDEFDAKRSGKEAYVMLPYEYAHDDAGNCVCLHYRERIVTRTSSFRWKGPVHEVLVSNETQESLSYTSEVVRIVHERQKIKKVHDPLRNLRILKDHCATHDDDPRSLYYLGLEQSNTGDYQGSEDTLKKYVRLSGWDDEIALAYMKLCELARRREDYVQALEYASKAVNVKENWGECYFELAKSHYFLGSQTTDPVKRRRSFDKCVMFSKIGLSCPPTKTVLFVNPQDREFEIHRYLNFALNEIGDVASALDSVNIALSSRPDDQALLKNKKLYEIHLAKSSIERARSRLTELGSTEDVSRENSWKAYRRPADYPRGVESDDFPVAQITPHSQAWGIPDCPVVIDDLPLRMTDRQLQSLVCAVWKEYILHDEILSAIKFLESTPYRVRHTDVTERALKLTKDMIKWTTSEDTYDVGNSTLNGCDVDSGIRTSEMIPLQYPLRGAAEMRMTWITDRMKSGSSLLDFGCIDGEMTNRWAQKGFDVTGLDVCSNSVKIANDSAEKNGTGARHIRTFFKDAHVHLAGKKFDYVTCADTYEHITDDAVESLLKPMRDHVKDDGRLLLVTPHGAWFRGEYVKESHPWLWAETRGDHWLAPNDRGHVIAPTVWSVVDEVRKAGWWVKNCVVVPQWYQDVPGQGNVCVEALTDVASPWPDGRPVKDVVFFVGDLAGEEWTPHTIDIRGMGGSETAVVQMTKRLVSLGNRVRVYVGCGKYGEGIYDGVEYLTTDKFHDIKCDVLVVSRWSPALSPSLNVEASLRLLWTHDVVPHGLTPDLALRADKILVLSKWHRDNVIACFPFVSPDQVHVTRNGIDLSRFEKEVVRDPTKAVYSSSPDRGLECLLDVWPEIRSRVPGASLDVFYGFANWEKVASHSPDQKALMEKIRTKLSSLSGMGVTNHDRVNQQTLSKHFLESGVWTYPTWFAETSCITAMEAQAAGLRIVTSPIAALNETVSNRGTMIPGDWLSQEYRRLFVDAVVDAMTRPGDDDRRSLRAYAREAFSWDDVARDWHDMFGRLTAAPVFPKYYSGASR